MARIQQEQLVAQVCARGLEPRPFGLAERAAVLVQRTQLGGDARQACLQCREGAHQVGVPEAGRRRQLIDARGREQRANSRGGTLRREDQHRPLAALQFPMHQFHFAADGGFEAPSQLRQRGPRACAQDDVEGLAIGPGELVPEKGLEGLEELAIPEEQDALVVEVRSRMGQAVGFAADAAGPSQGLG